MDTIYRPADTDNDILRKILVQYGGFPRPGDFDNSLYRKILTQLGGTFRPGDGTSELLRKIATRLGAGPLPGDTTNKLLYRIDQSLATEPRPGDYDNILLRKWLSPNALVPTPGTIISIVPKVNPPATQAEVTATITGGTNLIGEWLGFWVLEYSTPQQNITANYQLVAAHLVTAMPFTITFPIPVPSVIPSTVCVAIVKGPTQASVSSTPYKTKGAYKQCFAYPTNFIVVNIGGPPVAPVATAATSFTTTSFSANWNSSATATSYHLDVSTVNNFASFVTGYNNLNVGNVLTQSVTGLTAGTTYYFRVRAVNGFGTSSNSNIITSITIPAAPVATSASAITDVFFTANWNSSTGASDYRLDVATDAGFTSFVSGFNNTSVGNVTNASVSGLTAGTTYYFRVRATNTSGASADSNTISTITIPAAPTATAASSVTATTFAANWNASTGASSYRLDVATDSGFTSFVSGFNDLNVGNVVTASVTGLTAATTYYYRVRAVDASGTSGNSNTITQDTLAAAPTATAATSVTDVSFAANWGAVTGATSYRLDVATDAGFTSFVSGYNDLNVGNVVTQSVTGLTQNTTYYFRVRTVNGGGTSGNSNTITTLTYNTEVIGWVSRVVGQSSTVSQGTKDAVNTFVSALKTASILTKIKRCGVYAGDTLNALKAPLINTIGTATDNPNGFVSGDYSEATGLTGNTSGSKQIQTGLLITDAALGDNDIHMSCYVRTGSNEGSVCMGAQTVPNDTILMPANGGTTYWDCNNAGGGRISASDSLGKGFYVGSRVSSSSSVLYKNATSIASTTNAGGSRPATPGSLFVHDVGDSAGSHAATSRTLSFYSIGTGLTSSEVTAFNSAVQALQTYFGRNV